MNLDKVRDELAKKYYPDGCNYMENKFAVVYKHGWNNILNHLLQSDVEFDDEYNEWLKNKI